MNAISLYQPWASLMVMGFKKIETRSWATKYRGPLAIHAAKQVVPYIDKKVMTRVEEVFGMRIIDLPRGGIIGTVELIDCSTATGNIYPEEPERSFGDYSPGRYMWLTKEPKPFKKIIPFRGYQRLFNVPDAALRVCRVCGCSEFNACEGGCAWIEKDLCSACASINPYFELPSLSSLLPAGKVLR